MSSKRTYLCVYVCWNLKESVIVRFYGLYSAHGIGRRGSSSWQLCSSPPLDVQWQRPSVRFPYHLVKRIKYRKVMLHRGLRQHLWFFFPHQSPSLEDKRELALSGAERTAPLDSAFDADLSRLPKNIQHFLLLDKEYLCISGTYGLPEMRARNDFAWRHVSSLICRMVSVILYLMCFTWGNQKVVDVPLNNTFVYYNQMQFC